VRATRREALIGGGAVLLASAGAAHAASAGDAGLLQGLLARERRLENAYDAALRRDLLDAAVARRLRDQERAHIRGLEQALSRMGQNPPRAAKAPRIPGRERFASFALDLEAAAVVAYLQALERLRDEALLLPLGSIAANQGQHMVILRETLGLPLLEGSLAVS
jgi:rubrerythrin